MSTSSTTTSRRLAALALVLAACGAPTDEPGEREPTESEPAKPAAEPEPAAPANPLGNLGAMGAMLSARASQPGPYDEPRTAGDGGPHAAVLELEGPVVELRSFDLLGDGAGVELRALTDRLVELAADEQITGLVLRLGPVQLDLTAAHELRAALAAFKTAGGRTRSVGCHAERAADAAYVLMAACDTVGLAPTGELALTGAAAMPIHLKGLMGKLGVTADVVHIGAFKGAAEPLTRDAPSPEMTQTLRAILDASYETTVAAVADGRSLPPARVEALIDRALFSADDAMAEGLVDRVATFEAFRDMVAPEGWAREPIDDAAEPGLGQLMQLLGLAPRERPRDPHVALVYALGEIVDGSGEGVLGARRSIASRSLAAALRALARDDRVRAVVLRIDSPGGSALASELILRAVIELRERKPVVVSMGSVAASGGYYIACKASEVFADASTLTGSIGVVGGKLVVGGALAKLGITAHPMGRGQRALIGSAMAPWSRDERAAIRAMMEATYRVFVTHVAEGRERDYDDIHRIAQGRVWTGAAARERGLVDELGGLQAALARAHELAELEPGPLEVYPPDPTLFDMLGSLGRVRAGLPYGLDAIVATVARVLGPREASVVQRYLSQLVTLRDAPVQAALMWPLVR